jgi:hypothetical protein
MHGTNMKIVYSGYPLFRTEYVVLIALLRERNKNLVDPRHVQGFISPATT